MNSEYVIVLNSRKCVGLVKQKIVKAKDKGEGVRIEIQLKEMS